MVNILCIIPARSGSKGIKDKNIKIFNSKPLLAWSIIQAQQSLYDMKIIVSTDSEEYATIARQYGAEVPFLRPINISQDSSTDFECIEHTVNWLYTNEKYTSDIILQLRPTQPLRKIKDINACLELFIKNRSTYDSLRTAVPCTKSPYKMYSVQNNILLPLFKRINNINEPYNQCRQILPETYLHNGYIDIFNTDIIKKGTISGDKILPFIMKQTDTIDIDSISDWNNALSYI